MMRHWPRLKSQLDANDHQFAAIFSGNYRGKQDLKVESILLRWSTTTTFWIITIFYTRAELVLDKEPSFVFQANKYFKMQRFEDLQKKWQHFRNGKVVEWECSASNTLTSNINIHRIVFFPGSSGLRVSLFYLLCGAKIFSLS